MLTPGAIVATSVPFRSKMFSTFMTIPLCIPAEVGCRSQLLTAIILRLSRQDYADLQCQKSASAGPPLWIRSGLYAALSPARSERHHLQKVPIRAAGACFALRQRQEGREPSPEHLVSPPEMDIFTPLGRQESHGHREAAATAGDVRLMRCRAYCRNAAHYAASLLRPAFLRVCAHSSAARGAAGRAY